MITIKRLVWSYTTHLVMASQENSSPKPIVSIPPLLQRQTLTAFSEHSARKIQLPLWRNRVDIYMDEKAKSGFIASVNLDRLGAKTNWQRRFRHKYTELYVKELKPGQDTDSSTA